MLKSLLRSLPTNWRIKQPSPMNASPTGQIQGTWKCIGFRRKSRRHNSRNFLWKPGNWTYYCRLNFNNLFAGCQNQTSFLGVGLFPCCESSIRKRHELDIRCGNGLYAYAGGTWWNYVSWPLLKVYFLEGGQLLWHWLLLLVEDWVYRTGPVGRWLLQIVNCRWGHENSAVHLW